MNSLTKTNRKLNAMSDQEVFDTVAKHLLTQGEKCLMPGSSKDCAYRSIQPDGHELQCAAGCLIEEDEYDSDLEGKAWDDLVYAGIVTDAHMGIIRNLQSIHDEQGPSSWRFSLMNFAIDHNLDPKVLHEL